MLVLTLKNSLGAELHSGTLDEWNGGAYNFADAITPSASVSVTFEVSLPIGADNTLQDTDAVFDVEVYAQQAEFTDGTAYQWTAGWN